MSEVEFSVPDSFRALFEAIRPDTNKRSQWGSVFQSISERLDSSTNDPKAIYQDLVKEFNTSPQYHFSNFEVMDIGVIIAAASFDKLNNENKLGELATRWEEFHQDGSDYQLRKIENANQIAEHLSARNKRYDQDLLTELSERQKKLSFIINAEPNELPASWDELNRGDSHNTQMDFVDDHFALRMMYNQYYPSLMDDLTSMAGGSSSIKIAQIFLGTKLANQAHVAGFEVVNNLFDKIKNGDDLNLDSIYYGDADNDERGLIYASMYNDKLRGRVRELTHEMFPIAEPDFIVGIFEHLSSFRNWNKHPIYGKDATFKTGKKSHISKVFESFLNVYNAYSRRDPKSNNYLDDAYRQYTDLFEKIQSYDRSYKLGDRSILTNGQKKYGVKVPNDYSFFKSTQFSINPSNTRSIGHQTPKVTEGIVERVIYYLESKRPSVGIELPKVTFQDVVDALVSERDSITTFINKLRIIPCEIDLQAGIYDLSGNRVQGRLEEFIGELKAKEEEILKDLFALPNGREFHLERLAKFEVGDITQISRSNRTYRSANGNASEDGFKRISHWKALDDVVQSHRDGNNMGIQDGFYLHPDELRDPDWWLHSTTISRHNVPIVITAADRMVSQDGIHNIVYKPYIFVVNAPIVHMLRCEEGEFVPLGAPGGRRLYNLISGSDTRYPLVIFRKTPKDRPPGNFELLVAPKSLENVFDPKNLVEPSHPSYSTIMNKKKDLGA